MRFHEIQKLTKSCLSNGFCKSDTVGVNVHANVLFLSQTSSSSSNVENLPPQVIKRVSKEVLELADSPPEGIKLLINEEDITDVQATIEGPGEALVFREVFC